MANLERKIRSWVEEGLISKDQADRLIEREKAKHFFSFGGVLVFLGGLAAACGICAIVASNWEVIPDAVKLGGMYAATGGLAAWLYQIGESKKTAFETGLFLYILLLFAVIGLNGQVFHLVSDSWKAFMFWSFLAFPLVLLSRKVFIGFVWLAILYTAFLMSPYVKELEEFFMPFAYGAPQCFALLSFLIFLTVWPVRDRRPVLLKPLCTFLFAQTVIPLLFPAMRLRHWEKAEVWTTPFVIFYSAMFLFGMWKLMPFKPEAKKAVSVAVFCFVVGVAVKFKYDFVYFLLELVQLLSLLAFAYFIRARAMFNVLSFTVGALILIRWLILFGTLMQTGAGLIATGAVLIAAAQGWRVLTRRVAERFERESLEEEGAL